MVVRTLLVALAAIPGAVIGSFLGTVVERLPRGLSPLRGRSACDHCGRPLDPAELVPVVSWIVQRGRCRSCGGSIGSWQLLAEMASMIIAMVAVGLWNGASALLVAVFGWQLLVLALLDARFLWLPRGLMILLGLTGGAAALAGIAPAPSPALALGGAALGYGLPWCVARAYRIARGRDGMGGGDPPLLGAIGLWVGVGGVVSTLLGASVMGLVAAVAIPAAGRKIGGQTALPLGTFLAVTAWAVFALQAMP